MLVKNQYQGETDRRARHGALCYQIRQAFPHGEVTAEEANRIGYETAMRWTKGKYQFFVCTHIDKEHIHNHIYYNSPPMTAPGSSETSSAPRSPCGGCLTGYVWSTTYP